MRYQNVVIEAIGYELPPNVVTSRALEDRLAPLYRQLRIQPGQLEAWTGVRERRYWPEGTTMAEGASRAGRKARATSRISPEDIGILIYAGVCRDLLEPANACAVAHALGLHARTQIYDVSNACLAVLNGIIQIANAIELGQVRAGMVVSCESAKEIVDLTIDEMLRTGDMDTLRLKLATLTGGSGAGAVIVAHRDLAPEGRRLAGAALRSNAAHHELCRWWPATSGPNPQPTRMLTDAAKVLEHGVELGRDTWFAFLEEMGWTVEQIDRTICHQVGAPHRETVLKLMGVPPEKDFITYEFLGNIGTVSLPITAAIAGERGFLEKGQRVAFCGIGSGLNCIIMGVEW
ncbi:MAG TPA: 3-oxoacyl-ACP synthase III [Phycisphaerae bacterium]|nr:3-oxoacyl-ACP synthase III [Phycisphaerae bacterium]